MPGVQSQRASSSQHGRRIFFGRNGAVRGAKDGRRNCPYSSQSGVDPGQFLGVIMAQFHAWVVLSQLRDRALGRPRSEAVKKWDWLPAHVWKTRRKTACQGCLSQFFHSLSDAATATSLSIQSRNQAWHRRVVCRVVRTSEPRLSTRDLRGPLACPVAQVVPIGRSEHAGRLLHDSGLGTVAHGWMIRPGAGRGAIWPFGRCVATTSQTRSVSEAKRSVQAHASGFDGEHQAVPLPRGDLA